MLKIPNSAAEACLSSGCTLSHLLRSKTLVTACASGESPYRVRISVTMVEARPARMLLLRLHASQPVA